MILSETLNPFPRDALMNLRCPKHAQRCTGPTSLSQSFLLVRFIPSFPPPLSLLVNTQGLSSAVNTCVGNALGSGDGRAARRAAIVGLVCAVAVEAALVSGVSVFGKNMVG